MTATDINNLIHTGRMEEAYILSKQMLAEGNQPLGVFYAAGSATVEMIKIAADSGDKRRILDLLNEFKSLNLPADATAYCNLIWTVRTLFALEKNHVNQSWCNQLFDIIKDMPLTKPDKSYSALLNAVLKLKEWQKLGEFVEWWGFENLIDKDFEPFINNNGQKCMSLAERYDIAFCQYLLKFGDKDKIAAFLSDQESFVKQHSLYSYPPYYMAKLCLSVGQNERAIEALKPFAIKKSRDFWVWELLGDAHESAEDKLSFYSKALLCQCNDEGMLVGLYENAAELFEELEMLPESKWLTERALFVRDQKGWRHTNNLYNLSIKPWFSSTTAKLDKRDLMKYAEKAEEFLFGHTICIKVVVSHVNEEKNFISFMTEDRRSGFFRRPKNLKQIQKGDCLIIKCSGLAEKGPTRVVMAKKQN